MAGYTKAGTWLTDDGRVLQPQWTDNLGGFWFVNDEKDKSHGGYTRLPGAPPQTSGDTSFQPGGQFTTPDPVNKGSFYRDDPNVVGGIQRIDAQGNVTSTASHGDARQDPNAVGGTGWDLYHLDAQGKPKQVYYPQDSGGLFGLSPALGALLGSLMVVGGGISLGSAIPAVAGALGTAGAEAGTGFTLGNALQLASLANRGANFGQYVAGSGDQQTPAYSAGGTGDGMATSDISQVLAGLLGLTGTGLSLAGAAKTQGEQNLTYEQLQALYNFMVEQANKQNQRRDTQYQQQQESYDLSKQLAAYDRDQQQQSYQQRVAEVGKDRADAEQTLSQRNAIASKLADPGQAWKDAQSQITNPYIQQVEDRTMQVLSRDAASRGITPSGGAYRNSAAEAIAPMEAKFAEQSYQDYVNTLNSALSGYSYKPNQELTPGAQRSYQAGAPPSDPGQTQYPTADKYTTGAASQAQQDALKSLASILGGQGGNSGLIQAIASLISGGTGVANTINNLGTATGEGGLSTGVSTDQTTVQQLQDLINKIGSGGTAGAASTAEDVLSSFDTSSIPYDYGLEFTSTL